jgi:hypothetical protein
MPDGLDMCIIAIQATAHLQGTNWYNYGKELSPVDQFDASTLTCDLTGFTVGAAKVSLCHV